ncbi:hypothetical protein [Spirosoma areae]
MKYARLFFLFFPVSGFAQVQLPANEIGQVQYQEIVKLPNSKQPSRQVMEQARSWMVQHYRDELTAEQQHDQENNILFIKAAYLLDKQTIRYTLTIEPKVGRYRATITDLITESDGLVLPVRASSSTVSEMEQAAGGKITNKNLIEQSTRQQAELYKQIDEACRNTLASLKEALMMPNE